MPLSNLELVNEFAKDYDKNILKNIWNGPQVIFDETREFISSGNLILDLGIGTGESSKRFQEANCIIIGLDGSPKMLELCKAKNIGKKLVLQNLEETPFPLKTDAFNGIISNGVFHLTNPIKPIFSEAKRILKSKGIFAFSFENSDDVSSYCEIEKGVWMMKAESGVFTYKYSEQYIVELLNQNNFTVHTHKQFLAYVDNELQKETFFTIIVAQLK
ncbi:MAG: methyltransferase domain-containing protein [Draconibacterium sp.]|nr:methyltransferase domain-containing protein [Draconibacterium sp.]